jgi:hypothetical protein
LKGIADHAFVSTNCDLDLGPKIVATRLLPAHPTVLDDLLNVSVPLCRSGGALGASNPSSGTIVDLNFAAFDPVSLSKKHWGKASTPILSCCSPHDL